jgi:hypothetical protein
MVDQPNLSREGFQKLEFVGRRGDQLVYKAPSMWISFNIMISLLASS